MRGQRRCHLTRWFRLPRTRVSGLTAHCGRRPKKPSQASLSFSGRSVLVLGVFLWLLNRISVERSSLDRIRHVKRLSLCRTCCSCDRQSFNQLSPRRHNLSTPPLWRPLLASSSPEQETARAPTRELEGSNPKTGFAGTRSII